MNAYQPIDATPIVDPKVGRDRADALFGESLKALAFFDRFSSDDAAEWLAGGEQAIEGWVAAQLTIAKLNYPRTRRFWTLATIGALTLRSQGKTIAK